MNPIELTWESFLWEYELTFCTTELHRCKVKSLQATAMATEATCGKLYILLSVMLPLGTKGNINNRPSHRERKDNSDNFT